VWSDERGVTDAQAPLPQAEPEPEPAPVEPARPTDAAVPARPLGETADVQNDVIILALAALVVAAAFLLEPTAARDGVTAFGRRLPEVCTVKRFGAECAGCGLTRSFLLGVRLNPEAFRLHPAGPLLLAVVMAQLVYRPWRLWRRRRQQRAGLVEITSARSRRLWSWARWGLLLSVFVGWGIKFVVLRLA
jgi:hypothetical protein